MTTLLTRNLLGIATLAYLAAGVMIHIGERSDYVTHSRFVEPVVTCASPVSRSCGFTGSR